MGKVKQLKHKKFDRNIEISAPILDPEIIKAIHTPQKDQRLDIRHGGFKALLSDLNSQDSVDELTPITENHVPSYIGISCAVSGYSNYSSYVKKPTENILSTTTSTNKVNNRSQTNSPNVFRDHQVRHITIDKSNITSPDEERRKLTQELTASATERRPSPSPLPPIEDDRHHGAYVGARYFPMPPPSKLVNKHIPLLGIDDDQDPDDYVDEDEHKVEQKIASLYGDNFVEDWRESMSHKSKKEHLDEKLDDPKAKSPKDLVALKPAPKSLDLGQELAQVADVPTPNIKVLEGVEKQFLNRLLTDENPPMPKSPSPTPTSPTSPTMKNFVETRAGATTNTTKETPTESHHHNDIIRSETPIVSQSPIQHQRSPSPPVSFEEHRPSPSPTQEDQLISLGDTQSEVDRVSVNDVKPILQQMAIGEPEELLFVQDQEGQGKEEEEVIASGGIIDFNESAPVSPSPPPMSPDSGKNYSVNGDAALDGVSQVAAYNAEEHIEYEIRANSPLDNQSSPIRESTQAICGEADNGIVKEHDLVDLSSPINETIVDSNSNLEQLIDKSNESQLSSDGYKNKSHDVQQDQATFVSQTEPDLAQIESLEAEKVEDLAKQMSESLIEEPEVGQPNQVEGEEEEIEHKKAETVAANVSDNNSNGLYYLNLLDQEKSFINGQIERAQSYLDEHESKLDEDTVGRLRSAIGKANLLINKKCNQFKELCERSIEKGKDEQYAVLNDDLAGFWDMISIQILDVRKSFESL